jgi:sugar fermentation stimulation protein A
MPTSLVGVNTQVPNRLVHQAVAAAGVEELRGYANARREVKVGNHSRIDLLLSNGDRDRCYVEVKNCTLVENGVALFPDAVTGRGLKHLAELEALVAAGHRCVMFYLIQRMDAIVFRPADAIDPDYGKMLRKVAQSGVEIVAYDVLIDLSSISLHRKIPFEI